MLTVLVILTTLLCKVSAVTEEASSYCLEEGVVIVNEFPCLGDAFLRGNRIQLGVSNAGSFATSETIPAVAGAVIPNQNLGVLSDYNENGFSVAEDCSEVAGLYYYGDKVTEVCPTYSGDFVTPGAPLEGIARCVLGVH
jgi:hypothetical protein